MKLLLIGASGYVGSRLYDQLSKKHNVIGTYYKNGRGYSNLVSLNLSNPKDISEVLRRETPDVIVHAGGLTSVDYCERNKEEATRVNTGAIKCIVDNFDSKVIYFSTNYVFDGSKGDYIESDFTNPINHYGLTKAQAEKIVLARPDNLVVRLGSVYGYNSQNNKFFNRFFEGVKPKKEIEGCPELMLCPIYLEDIVNNFEKFIECEGIVHFTNGSSISEYDFFTEIGRELEFLVKGVSFDKLCKIAKRPHNATLSTERNLSFTITSLEDSLKK